MLNARSHRLMSVLGFFLLLLFVIGCGESTQPSHHIDSTVEVTLALEPSKDDTNVPIMKSSVEPIVQSLVVPISTPDTIVLTPSPTLTPTVTSTEPDRKYDFR